LKAGIRERKTPSDEVKNMTGYQGVREKGTEEVKELASLLQTAGGSRKCHLVSCTRSLSISTVVIGA
jgi:hypothetical protein